MTPEPVGRAADPDVRSDCAHTGVAAAYQLATLSPAEMDAFREHLADGCVTCAVELQSAREAVAVMDAAAVGVGTDPGDALRAQLLARVRESVPEVQPLTDATDDEQPWKRWAGPTGSRLAEGLATVRTAEGAWEPTAVDGVAVKRLAVDAERSMVTMLVKMDPGASYPPHRHGGAEECLVLDGDLQVAGETLHAGDYQQAEEGSVHGVQSTENGCLLFITSSQEDELLVGG